MSLARHFMSICALFSLISGFSLISSCSTAPKETPKGKMVKVIKGPFADTCIQLAKIKYDRTPFIHDKELTTILKEMTAQNKGNAVRYDIFMPGVTGVSNAKGRATVYRCHREKLRKYLLGVENKAFGEEEADPEYQNAKDANGGPVTPEAPPKAAAPRPTRSQSRPTLPDASSEP